MPNLGVLAESTVTQIAKAVIRTRARMQNGIADREKPRTAVITNGVYDLGRQIKVLTLVTEKFTARGNRVQKNQAIDRPPSA